MRAGNLREGASTASPLDQDLPRDAAFVVVGAADLEALDDRGYREAQFEAGLADGRLHLAAFALGAGACGMTFLDSEIQALARRAAPGAAVHVHRHAGVPRPAGRPAGRTDHDAPGPAAGLPDEATPAAWSRPPSARRSCRRRGGR